MTTQNINDRKDNPDGFPKYFQTILNKFGREDEKLRQNPIVRLNTSYFIIPLVVVSRTGFSFTILFSLSLKFCRCKATSKYFPVKYVIVSIN
jgi:hypothetical protein